MDLSRRTFLAGLGAAAVAPPGAPRAGGDEAPAIRFGYAAITWRDRYLDAIADVGAAGYRGIQLRANAVPPYKDDVGPLRDHLEKHGVLMVGLSSGNVALDNDLEAEVGKHLAHARFVKALGGSYLQLLDNQKTAAAALAAARIEELGRRMSEIGKRAGDLGIMVVYHNHMGALGEAPDEVARVLEASDERQVKLLLDTAHWQQGGGDPAAGMRKHAGRTRVLHLKDLVPADDPRRPYKFVELGEGRVDFPAFFAVLAETKWSGWAIVELDAVTRPGRSEKDSALLSKRYLEERIELKVRGPARG